MGEKSFQDLPPQVNEKEANTGEPNPFLIDSWPRQHRESFLHPFAQSIIVQDEFHAFLQQSRQGWLAIQGE